MATLISLHVKDKSCIFIAHDEEILVLYQYLNNKNQYKSAKKFTLKAKLLKVAKIEIRCSKHPIVVQKLPSTIYSDSCTPQHLSSWSLFVLK